MNRWPAPASSGAKASPAAVSFPPGPGGRPAPVVFSVYSLHRQMGFGAPPDYFDPNGQNWGFPTYNWEEMAKDGYLWWRRRLAHMAQ